MYRGARFGVYRGAVSRCGSRRVSESVTRREGEGIDRFDRSVSWRVSPAVRPWLEGLESSHPVGTTRGVNRRL